MTTTCNQCGAVAIAEEVTQDFSGICPGCLVDFTFDAPGELETLGKYRLIELLGSGGMRVVYRAEHMDLGKIVAVKLLRPYLTESEQERFRNEAKTLARVRHPNIVPIHDYGTERGWSYFVMDCVEAEPLSKRLTVATRDLVFVVRKAALAVEHLHEQGILHRDLKPANILVNDALEPFVVDFGLAKSADASLTPEGAIMGTPSYMSPEQVRGDDLDPKSDVFALGAVLYECLTGRPPFGGKSATQVLQKVLKEEPNLDGVEAPLARICRKAMEKERDRRYESAAQLAKDLERYLEGTEVQAPRAPWFRKRASVLLSAVGVLLIGVLLYVVTQTPPPSTPPAPSAPENRKPKVSLDKYIASIPNQGIRGLLEGGLKLYHEKKYREASYRFGKGADILQQSSAKSVGVSSEKKAILTQQGYLHLALCEWRRGRHQDALNEYRRAKEAGYPPENCPLTHVILYRDSAYRELMAHLNFESILNKTEEGIRLYQKGDFRNARFRLGKVGGYYLNHDPKRIHVPKDRFTRLRMAIVYMALCEWRAGYKKSAITEMRRAIQAGFRDDGSFVKDPAFQEVKAELKSQGVRF